MPQINAKYVAEHQIAVIDCLEDPDETLKKKTLDLLYKMTKPYNVDTIVARLLAFVRESSDAVVKQETVARVAELAERYAPSNAWFMVRYPRLPAARPPPRHIAPSPRRFTAAADGRCGHARGRRRTLHCSASNENMPNHCSCH